MNIYDLISRAQQLREETKLDSVSPDRVGALCEDTLKYINEFQLLASAPSLHKIYASVSAMQLDGAPQSDLTGKALKPGQLVVIVPESQTDATAGDVYRYDGPSGNTSAWTFVAKIGGVPADADLNASSTNPVQNKVVTEKLTELSEDIASTNGNLGQKPIDKIYTKEDFSGLIWNGTSIEKSSTAYNSIVVMIPPRSVYFFSKIAGTPVNQNIFDSFPQIGNKDRIAGGGNGYNNNTDKAQYLLVTISTQSGDEEPQLRIQVTSGGLLGAPAKGFLSNVHGNRIIKIKENGATALDGITITIPKGIIFEMPQKISYQPDTDVVLQSSNAYVYYLYIQNNQPLLLSKRRENLELDSNGILVATITPKVNYPVQGIAPYTYNGVTYDLVDVDALPNLKASVASHDAIIKDLQKSTIDPNAVDAIQGLQFNSGIITSDNTKKAIRKIWLNCKTAGNVEKLLKNIDEVYIVQIKNAPSAYAPYIGISTQQNTDDQIFTWYLVNQTTARTGVETITATLQTKFVNQYGITGYRPTINIEIDWDVFGENIDDKSPGIKLKLSELWRFSRNNVSLVESAKSFVGSSLIGKTIVCFGDSLTEMVDTTNALHYTDYMSAFSGATFVNCGIGGTQLRQRMNPSLTPSSASQAYAALDVVHMVKAACQQDFSMQIAANDYIIASQNDDNSAAIENLISIDWSKVDAVTIFAGTNDWYNTKNSIGQSGSNDIAYTLGAINEIIKVLSSTYPHVKIFFFTPIVRWLDYVETSGKGTDANWSDTYVVEGNGTLKEEVAAIQREVMLNHIPICDMYNTLGWNKYNFSNYFQGQDGTHPKKEAGVMMLAKKILSFIMSNNTL